jgi:ankyrin repeat protein
MKLILVYEEENKNIADRLTAFIKKKKYNLTVTPMVVEGNHPESLTELFSGSSHILALLSPSAALSPWFVFTAGFSLGSGHTLLYYPAVPDWVPPPLLDRFTLIGSEKTLGTYLARETKDWDQREAVRQARQALLDRGIPVSGESLENCIRAQNGEAVSCFLQAGFSPNHRDKTGVPLLCLAARAGDRDIVRLLLHSGASVNLQAEDRDSTALIDSTAGKHTGIMELLLKAGADVNLKSKDGQSALILAVGLNDEVAVEMLLKAGANPDDPDSLGASARKYAQLFNKPAMVALFTAYAGP